MEPTPELLLRLARSGPRYTSYPTAPVWRPDFSPGEREAAFRAVGSPASVYVHLPFCQEQCWFCGCAMVVGTRRDVGAKYLDLLERQVAELPLPAEQIDVARIHLGGGTPTWYTPEELERLYAILYGRFRPIEGAEISVEADPEITTDEQVDALAELGVNRLSLGVQSFDARVLGAVNRPQQATRVFAVLDRARSHGMYSLNVDLMYGLPHQTPESFAGTLDRILEARPDRLAIFGYAHVPWLKPHQKLIDGDSLPDPVQRVDLFLQAHRRLVDAGYEAIGLDHFALPDDELSVAQREGRLHRNFMGYTTRPGLELIGVGMSAISELRGAYVQEKSRLGRWERAVESGAPSIEKGCTLTAEDHLRRDVINALMCNFRVRIAEIEGMHGVDFREHFASEIEALEPLEAQGLVERDTDEIRVTDLGRLLVRNVAMTFDAYLRGPAARADKPRFSQTV